MSDLLTILVTVLQVAM